MLQFVKRLFGDKPEPIPDFSLVKKMAGLENRRKASFPSITKDAYLHLGCGDNILPGFINVDFLPGDGRVVGWNLLDPWPEEMKGAVSGVFSEDILEHFYYEEQMYFLCEANICLQMEGINRVLMPAFDRVVGLIGADNNPYWPNLYGVDAQVDRANAMLRHSGHRWLHDADSMAGLARKCGYEPIRTSCAESTDPKLANVNLRNEVDSLSFATDLKKVRPVSRMTVRPSEVHNAVLLESDDMGAFYRSTTDDPIVIYDTPDLSTEKLVLLNARGFNITPPFEHNITKFYFGPDEKFSFYNDRSLLSATYNNFVQGDIVRRIVGQGGKLDSIRVDPSESAGMIFYAGDLDIFVLDQPASAA